MRLCDAYTWKPEDNDVALFNAKEEIVGVWKEVPEKGQEDRYSISLALVYFGDDMPYEDIVWERRRRWWFQHRRQRCGLL